MLGRPNWVAPVFMKIWPGAWLNAMVFIELMIVMSSTTSARSGSASDNSAPHLPCFANLNLLANSAASGWMKAYRWSLTISAGMDCPSYFSSTGR